MRSASEDLFYNFNRITDVAECSGLEIESAASWTLVLFEQSKFNYSNADGRSQVYCRVDERCIGNRVFECESIGKSSVMVRGAKTTFFYSQFVILNSTVYVSVYNCRYNSAVCITCT